MDALDQLVLKRTLDALRRIGSTGLAKADVLDAAELSSGRLLTTEQRETLWNLLVERRYISGHMEPVTHIERWTLTERGMTALDAL
jgi:hypothetical protein